MKLSILLRVGVACFAIGLASCGSSNESASPSGSNDAMPLSADAESGKVLAASRCMGCHSTDGKSRSGPTFKALAGSTRQLADGTTAIADTQYLIRSITDPGAQVVKDYPNVMATAVPKGSISEDQARQIAAYIEALR